MSDDAERNAEVTSLMDDARKQLDEHAAWLMNEIEQIPASLELAGGKAILVGQCAQIKLTMVRAHDGRASVVWGYPDELYAFLRHPATPKHLRDTLRGGALVSNTEQATTHRRLAAGEDEDAATAAEVARRSKR